MSHEPKTLDCPKCQARMSPGVLPSIGGQAWASRLPSYFHAFPGRVRQIVTYCCEDCGYLESYGLPRGVTLKSVLPKK